MDFDLPRLRAWCELLRVEGNCCSIADPFQLSSRGSSDHSHFRKFCKCSEWSLSRLQTDSVLIKVFPVLAGCDLVSAHTTADTFRYSGKRSPSPFPGNPYYSSEESGVCGAKRSLPASDFHSSLANTHINRRPTNKMFCRRNNEPKAPHCAVTGDPDNLSSKCVQSVLRQE